MVFLMDNKMLFCLGKSFANSIAAGDRDSIDCLLRMLDSRKRGLLLIYSSNKAIDLIVAYFQQSGDGETVELLRTMSKKFRHKKQLLKDLTAFVLVGCSGKRNPRRRGNVIHVAPDFINKSNVLYPPILLGENLTDCELYAEGISKNFIDGIPQSLSELQLFDRFESGGGNSTHYSYSRHKQKSMDFCFCIVDSDRAHPSKKLGDTAKFVVNVDKNHKSPLCDNLVIDMYSAENLLPMDEIERQFNVGKSQQQISQFAIAKKIRGMNSWRHLPLKQGINGGDLKKVDMRSQYWAGELKAAGMTLPCCEDPSCSCNLVPSISDKTLATALKPENAGWRSKLNREDSQYIRSDYSKISTELRSWLCVGAPIRS
ncbi:hypothetical protein [Acidovorax benzenivorans]|nr:hypothetical protein [Acidovorax benzenivorans]